LKFWFRPLAWNSVLAFLVPLRPGVKVQLIGHWTTPPAIVVQGLVVEEYPDPTPLGDPHSTLLAASAKSLLAAWVELNPTKSKFSGTGSPT
jgi:hypothetical protein